MTINKKDILIKKYFADGVVMYGLFYKSVFITCSSRYPTVAASSKSRSLTSDYLLWKGKMKKFNKEGFELTGENIFRKWVK